MPIYIRDENAEKMAIHQAKETTSIRDKIRPAMQMATNISNHTNPDFDMKKYTDEMWGE